MYGNRFDSISQVAMEIQKGCRRSVLHFDDLYQALPICGFDVGIRVSGLEVERSALSRSMGDTKQEARANQGVSQGYSHRSPEYMHEQTR